MGAKSKRLIELQFEMEEIQKARKRQAAEMEENQSRMVRERES